MTTPKNLNLYYKIYVTAMVTFIAINQFALHWRLGYLTKHPFLYPPQQDSIHWTEDIRNNQSHVQTANLLNFEIPNPATAVGEGLTEQQKQTAEKYNNLGLILNPEKYKHIDAEVRKHKLHKCLIYIDKYRKIAQEEFELFGVPIAIKLAQAMLESNVGESALSAKHNNHFGIKCKGKCDDCVCVNYADDDPDDLFREFTSAWFSFREHSKLLQGKRYSHLLQLERTDYKNWAYGLKAAGYATDKQYAKKLIAVIEAFKLYELDRK